MSNYNNSWRNADLRHQTTGSAHPQSSNYLRLDEIELQQQLNSIVHKGKQPQGPSNKFGYIDISKSVLQPTAQEFHPGTSYQNVQELESLQRNASMAHTGAIRKDNHFQNNPIQRGKKITSQDFARRRNEAREFEKSSTFKNKPFNQKGLRNNERVQIEQNHSKPNQNNYQKRNNNFVHNKFKDNNKSNHYNSNNAEQTRERNTWRPRRNEVNDSSSSSANWRERKPEELVKQDDNSKRKHEKGNKSEKEFNNKSSADVQLVEEKLSKEENHKKQPNNFRKKLDAATQRERLEHMVMHRMLECLVCCEKLRHVDKVWSCKQCYHILHLSCVQKWAHSSKLDNGWRCPACQNVLSDIPNEYRCYCDKYFEPIYEPGQLAHSCGEICARKGRNCSHKCTLRCHPGACPDCTLMVQRSCGCGAKKPTVQCKSNIEIVCDEICNKQLKCNVHRCTAKCHWGDCAECDESIKQECYCGKQGRKVKCTLETQNVFTYGCADICDKLLACGNHKCKKVCHEGPCENCPLDPSLIQTCPCGKTRMEKERTSCLDPIPCCENVCGKKLRCGQPSEPHLCTANCHEGSCPECPLSTMVRCRCGHMDRELACKDLTTKADDARCKKKCTKKRSCTKHKCNQLCCIEIEHECPLPCTYTLSCGLHKCELNCHKGRCPACWRSSFEELYCDCGSSVIYPPVPCGTRPPACIKPCSRVRPCGHEPHHNCHPGACPPCTLFTVKLCYGKHESRATVPCYQNDFSCGLPCNKPLPCGQHKCVRICHDGPCPAPCKQPCTIPRANCEHGCNQPCHEPPCPTVPCKQTVIVTCQCGLRSSTRMCMDMAGEYQKFAMFQLASKMADIQRGQSVDIGDIVNTKKRNGSHKTLECNDECRMVERNRRLAIGLQIRNPDLSSKLTPRYSDYMKQWVKKDVRFCQSIHDKLTELVKLAKESKHKSRSHSFECMNREKRHFVHEYCEHFGCESAAYDVEPNRNVVATAIKDKSWLPSCSVIELIQRENGHRKVPGPVMNKSSLNRVNLLNSSTSGEESVPVRLQSQVRPAERPLTPQAEFKDYFDDPPV